MSRSHGTLALATVLAMAFPLIAVGRGPGEARASAVSTGVMRAGLERPEAFFRSDPEEIFRIQCAPCHGARGEGDGPAAVAFNPRPANLADAELMEARTDAELRAVLERGKGSMPAFGPLLAPADIDSLVRYIRTLSGG